MREVDSLDAPLDVELWASHMLGAMWEERMGLPLDEWDDYALTYGAPLVEAIADTGAPGARAALTALAAVDDGELGMLAGKLAVALPKLDCDPSWLSCVGETTVTSAAAMRENVFDDGFTVFLAARHATGDSHALGVYIDNNLGVMAKDIVLTDSIDGVREIMRENPVEDGELSLESIDPAAAAAEIRAAIRLTEMTLDPPVADGYAPLRALAMLRADEVPGVVSRPDREEMPTEARDALREEFLSAPEGRAFASDGDEAFAVSLIIDFCADYVDGDPLRWSPMVVELFMADWLPRKVLADEDLLAALPSALDAWVRFAGRKRGIGAEAIETIREAIPLWRVEMASAASDPASHGEAKKFLMAAQEAGVDVADDEALMTFMAGWNARSIRA